MNNIKKLRIAMNLTQEELGKRLNVRKSSVSRYESEKIALQPDILSSMANIFNVSTDCVLGRENIPEGYPICCIGTKNTAPVLPLSDEALEIARKYDRVDKRGQGNIKSVVEREYKMTIEGQTEDVGASL